MMVNEFISKMMKVSFYKHKEGTTSSYYHSGGVKLLPNRLSLSREKEIVNVQRKGRNILHPITGQLLSRFKVNEESPLKQYKPYECRTQLWQVPQYPLFIGYGTIGISSESGRIEGDTGDLVVLYSIDDWENIAIFYFAGMGNPDSLGQVMQFLNEWIKTEFNKEGNASQHPLQKRLSDD